MLIKTHIRWKIILISLLIVVLAVSGRVSAQDSADTRHIVGVRTVLALPVAISFRVRIDAPHTQVEQAMLTIEQESGLIRTLELDLERTIFLDYGDQIEYEYTWDVIEQPGLMMFQLLTYRFEVMTVDGMVSVVEETVDVEFSASHQQTQAPNAPITLYWFNPSIGGTQLVNSLGNVYAMLDAHVGFEQTLSLALHESPNLFCERWIDPNTGQAQLVVFSENRPWPCSPEDTRTLYRNNDIVPIITSGFSYVAFEEVLTQTIVEMAYADLWQDPDAPMWFLAGLQSYYLPGGLPEAASIVRRAAQLDRLLRLSQMTESPTTDNADLWQAQATLLTLYLADQYSALAPVEIAAALINSDRSFEDVLAQVANKPIEQIYRAWSVWVNSPRAIEVAQWTIYQPMTPTPTPTLTPTTIPPSRTPRPTATTTLTPTQRPLYIPPSPHINTPTPPLSRPTASNTPLPPGAFDTPTPAPRQNSSDGDNGICGTGIGALLLPIAGLFLARRKHA